FDKNYELEAELEKKGKRDLLHIVRNVVPAHVSCLYVRQPEALGLGHAVLCAQPIVGDEPFAVILADDLIAGEGRSCLHQMVERFQQRLSSILGVERVSPEETASYGIIEFEAIEQRFSKVL